MRDEITTKLRCETSAEPRRVRRKPTSRIFRARPLMSHGQARAGTLLVLTGMQAGRLIELPSEGRLVLGRGEGADETFLLGSVSREHAVIEASEGDHHLRDLGSANGTYLGRGPVRGSVGLWPGDRIQLGTQLALRYDRLARDEIEVLSRTYESSVRDPLTQAFNRRYFHDRLAREVSYAQRHERDLAALMIDVDHFKRVNDRHGHPVGDAVLTVLTAALDRLLRPEDVLARYGGEELCVLARGLDERNGVILGERLRRAIEELDIPVNGSTVGVTVSVGVASLRGVGDASELVQSADEALYRAKAAGRNRVRAFGREPVRA